MISNPAHGHGMRRGAIVFALLLAWRGASPLPAQVAAPEPWPALTKARGALAAAGRLGADFVQSFTPVGFDRGERESGRLALALPDCLRWDYELPYAKSFLLCGGLFYYWTPGEKHGRRSEVEASREPGLDLLLLPIEQLSTRYRATASAEPNGGLTIRLVPLAANAPLRDAAISFDAAGERPTRLSYHDAEGSLTEFELTGFRPLADREVFTPPAGVEWREE